MQTETIDQTVESQDPQPQTNKGNVVAFSPPRFQYDNILQERFEIDRVGWKTLCEVTFPLAKSGDSIAMALAYCRARNLDIFKKPIHIVPMWSTALGRMVETVWPGIAELRTTAFRTKQYCGLDSIEWGEIVEKEFKGKATKGAYKGTQRTKTVKYPEWCRITVLREQNGRVGKFIGPKVVWMEAYAQWGDTDVPNDMWCDRPEGQLEKCAEAAALRRAFPEELGSEYAAEEMEGRHVPIEGAAVGIAAAPLKMPPDPPGSSTAKAEPKQTQAAPNPPGNSPNNSPAVLNSPTPANSGEQRQKRKYTPRGQKAAEAAAKAAAEQQQAGVPLEQTQATRLATQAQPVAEQQASAPVDASKNHWPLRNETKPTPTTSKMSDSVVLDDAQWLRDLEGSFGGCEDAASLFEAQKKYMMPHKKTVSPEAWKKAEELARDRLGNIQAALMAEDQEQPE